ncbi:FecCD family ABC transporter permease [Desulfobaculum bizertense]|uniref:Iron complex transport system permease protein n=1 Tax=Desulfobaculum bizertense DSM 18034 TaxID=1121442 RepID=A0A1T4VGZ8_9BACT|nr:iron ABC transporter permease [Desulfobaculum bizertense]SKA64215.1 iron complex transport system permease protein [Desulfobaculum bizertense DSM 18034]
MNTGTQTSRSRARKTTLLLGLLLVLVFALSLGIGRISIKLTDLPLLFQALVHPDLADHSLHTQAIALFWVRLPRCIMTALVGAGLALSGAVYQGLFRNPLVSPDILGVSAGATFGAALGFVVPGVEFFGIQALAFAFGLLAVGCALLIAKAVAVKPMLVLVLAGLVVLSVFNAGITTLKYMADPYNELPAIVFWIMGSMSRASWNELAIAAPLVGGAIILAHLFCYRLNILSLGDAQALSLGVNPKPWRILFITTSSMAVAVSVATCGQVGWVGLVIPHIARTLVGPNHEHMLPVSTLTGAIFLLLADTAARSLSGAEIPISVITAFTGAPFFAFLLYKNRGSGWS